MKNTYKSFIIAIFITFCCPHILFAKQIPSLANQQISHYVVEDYNAIPGTQELDLFGIETRRTRTSSGVLSPDASKAVYSEVYYYPQNMQTSSRLMYFDTGYSQNNPNNPQYNFSSTDTDRIINPKSKLNKSVLIMEVGMDTYDYHVFRTLTLVDWSSNGRKLLIKEKAGEHYGGIWDTHLWVYDFDTKKSIKIDGIRKAITYYWYTRHNLSLNSYRWDITPLGWDFKYPDSIIVNAYGYNYDGKVFLGCWSIDSLGRRSKLLSLSNEHWRVGKYGKILKSDQP